MDDSVRGRCGSACGLVNVLANDFAKVHPLLIAWLSRRSRDSLAGSRKPVQQCLRVCMREDAFTHFVVVMTHNVFSLLARLDHHPPGS